MGSFLCDGLEPTHLVGIVLIGTDCQVRQQPVEGNDRYNAITTVVERPSQRKTLADLSVPNGFH